MGRSPVSPVGALDSNPSLMAPSAPLLLQDYSQKLEALLGNKCGLSELSGCWHE